jgi:hypothetical protein
MARTRPTPPPESPDTPLDLFETKRKASSALASRIDEAGSPIRPDGQFACAVCGGPAHFGFGVKLLAGQLGRWSCAEHRELVARSTSSPKNTR